MRHHPVDVLDLQAILVQCLVGAFRQHPHRGAVHRLAVHLDEGVATQHAVGDAAIHSQDAGQTAIGMQVAGEDARCVGSFEHHRAGPVAEQHAGPAVAPVQEAREHFRAHHQRALVGAAGDQAVGQGQGVDESGAHRLYIEGGALLHAQPRLQQAGGGRQHHVRRGGGDHDQIHLVGAGFGRCQRALAGVKGEVGGHFAFGGDMTGFDASARDDPLVAGLDAGLQLLVADAAGREITAGANDSCVGHGRELSDSPLPVDDANALGRPPGCSGAAMGQCYTFQLWEPRSALACRLTRGSTDRCPRGAS